LESKEVQRRLQRELQISFAVAVLPAEQGPLEREAFEAVELAEFAFIYMLFFF
jgi:hypothetical protein